jgi:CHAT domain-containing protein
MGDYEKSESLEVQSHDIFKRVLGIEHPNYASSLNNLGILNRLMGNYARAERLYLEACEIRKRVLGTGHPSYAQSLSNLAVLYVTMGECARAEALHVQALEIRRRVMGPEHPQYATSVNNLAVLYDVMGEHAKAEPLFVEALDIRRRRYGTEHPDYAQGLNNLASLYLEMRELAKAEALLVESRDVRKRVLGTEHPEYAHGLHDLATLYVVTGDDASAATLYGEARDIGRRMLGPEHPDYARSLKELAAVHYRQEDYANAQPLFLEACEVFQRASEKTVPLLAEAQALNWLDTNRPPIDFLLGNLRRRSQAEPATAYDWVWKTKSLVTRMRLNQHLGPSPSGEAQQLFSRLGEARLKLARLISSIPSPAQADAFRKQIAEANERKEALEKELASINTFSARAFAIRDATVNDLLAVLPRGVAIIDFLQVTDWQPVDDIIEMAHDETPERRQVKRYQAAVHYDAFVLRRNGDAPTDRSVAWIPLGPAQPINDTVAAWRAQLTAERQGQVIESELVTSGTNSYSVENPQGQLRTLIWKPLEEHLAGCQTVIILPDGALTQVPWGAIPGRAENTFLIDEYAIATASYGQQLYGLLSADPVADGPLLVAGGIDYDQRNSPDNQHPSDSSGDIQLAAASGRRSPERGRGDVKCEYLKGATAESEHVVQKWILTQQNQVHRLLSGADADEARLMGYLPQSRYAHLATHGFFAAPEMRSLWQFDIREEGLFGSHRDRNGRRTTVSRRNPLLLSGIFVAGANLPPERDALGLTTGEDGVLTAEELASLNLCNTELITLSACETGLGDVAAGEGVFGLQRALHQAGVRSVIASLWKVDDRATQALMSEFYHHLWHQKLGKLESLRQAQLSMLRNYDSTSGTIRGLGTASVPVPIRQARIERLSPYYWAAFQLSGDWR